MPYIFLSRILLYLIAISTVFFHKGIALKFDTAGIILYFVLIPIEMVLAFLTSVKTKKDRPVLGIRNSAITAAAVLTLIIIFFSGIGANPFLFLSYGAAAYLLTLGLFRFKWYSISIFEILFIAGVYVRLINFTRGSEQIARQSGGFTKTLLFLALGALAAHILLLYRAASHSRQAGHSKEGSDIKSFKRKSIRDYLILACVLIPVLLLGTLIMPSDYIEHSVVFNQLFDKARPDPEPIEGNNKDNNDGSIEGQSDLEAERGRNGEPGLSGVPSNKYGEAMGNNGSGTDKQYSVMVVASKQDPVYLADAYYEGFDMDEGFYKRPENALNELVYMRFIETWENPEKLPDKRRLETDVSVFSIYRERVLAYYPLRSAPLVYNTRYYPFSYSYESVSDISVSDRWDWVLADELSEQERNRFAAYIDTPLNAETKSRFMNYLDNILEGDETPGEKVLAILSSFSEHQYNLGFTEDTSVEHIEDFLLTSKVGDCTEFSNAAALLGRLAGIPSRVVTGYLASSGLQTKSHLFGLYNLQQNMPPLQKFHIGDLYLITTAHKHSWTQYYLSGYGWIDFESTDYAIPPPPGGDANTREVVIPLITEQTVKGEEFRMPWQLIFELSATAIIAGIIILFSVQGGLILLLARRSGKISREGVKAVEQLMLIRLIRDGYPAKKPSTTINEYAEGLPSIPELSEFANTYNQLRFRLEIEKQVEAYEHLKKLGTTIPRNNKNKGIKAAFKRLLSLKGLRYF